MNSNINVTNTHNELILAAHFELHNFRIFKQTIRNLRETCIFFYLDFIFVRRNAFTRVYFLEKIFKRREEKFISLEQNIIFSTVVM